MGVEENVESYVFQLYKDYNGDGSENGKLGSGTIKWNLSSYLEFCRYYNGNGRESVKLNGH